MSLSEILLTKIWTEPTEEQRKILESLGARIEQKSNGTVIWVVNVL